MGGPASSALTDYNNSDLPSSQKTSNPAAVQESGNIGEIHSLYQELFLTDIKKEVESAQTELKQSKQEQNTAQREMAGLKKENQQLHATLKRYRKMLQELTNSKKEELSGINFMSPVNLQKMHMMSFDSVEAGQQKGDQSSA